MVLFYQNRIDEMQYQMLIQFNEISKINQLGAYLYIKSFNYTTISYKMVIYMCT